MSIEDVSGSGAQTPVHRDLDSREKVFKKFLTSNSINEDLVDVLLSDELTDLYCKLIESYEAVKGVNATTERERIAKGSLLFLLLHRSASLPREKRPVAEAEINAIATNDDFLLVFHKFYSIPPEIGLQTLSFHAAGTTSLIFKADTDQFGLCALKVIQAPYVRSKEIQIATASYRKTYGSLGQYSPKVHRSEALWILMSFVEGINLFEFTNRLRKSTRSKHGDGAAFISDENVPSVAAVFHLLTQALAHYDKQKPAVVHGDLNPLNMIVKYDGNSPVSLTLIDFGTNYVLKQRLGSRQGFAEAYARAELFTDPEVLNGNSPASMASDFYSLGMICLDMLCMTPLRSETVGVRLSELWKDQASIGMAEIIEDLIERKPNQRLLVLRRDPEESVYETLDAAFQSHVKLYSALVEDRRNVGSFSGLLDVFDVTKVAKNIAKAAKNPDTSYGPVSRGQRYAAALNVAAFAILAASFAIYTAMDFQDAYKFKVPLLSDAVEFVQTLIAHYPYKFHVGKVWDNLPGRMVALTFGMIAARYYANIFSYLEVSGLGGLLQPVTNLMLRVNSVSYFLPIMYAIVVDPQQWPLCAFTGTLFPALNNLFCRWVALRSREGMAKTSSIEPYHQTEAKEFLDEYREWFWLMLAYSFSMLAIDLVFRFELAKDKWIYAAIVCAINIGKIYRNNCGQQAPKIAGNLARSFFDIRRVTAAKEKNPGGNTAQSPTVIAAKTA